MSVVSGCDASPVLEAAEEAFDDVPASIDTLVERVRCATRSGRGDDGFDAPILEPVAQAVGIIGFVGEQAPGWSCSAQQRYRHADIGDVARCQREGDRSAAIVGQAMDLAGPTATRAADRFFILPLFEPAAER